MERLFWQLDAIGNFWYIKIQHDSKSSKHEQTYKGSGIHFLSLCPLRLIIMLNINLSKVAYGIGNCRCREH